MQYFGQTTKLPTKMLCLQEPMEETQSIVENSPVVFRSLDSQNTFKSIQPSLTTSRDRITKKRNSTKTRTIKSSLEFKERTTTPLTKENLEKINRVVPVHKYIRIVQWVNSNDDSIVYPHPSTLNAE
ncbi:hypothetical protein EIN_327690 [Entamoeba invadens IP1]|uniref:Uncharacterized protein n=1 Tax=Entamoeba invadens IP1 TaxID=370355 RepID=A0A0A1TXK2_ENTIV|nr:hypothetical protein EIN_327690 [Entamoeba invadens IP1]ELP86112.1 hypothetical protein EIN_327690 [Entamoeba invadens IP1]|eukprot:XP_004185458.1 hypothetical protein EIN_327690 [Entamoeba invadens IP1]